MVRELVFLCRATRPAVSANVDANQLIGVLMHRDNSLVPGREVGLLSLKMAVAEKEEEEAAGPDREVMGQQEGGVIFHFARTKCQMGKPNFEPAWFVSFFSSYFNLCPSLVSWCSWTNLYSSLSPSCNRMLS